MPRRNIPLIDLTIEYFKRRGYTIERDVVLVGESGSVHKFDLKISKGKRKQLVSVKSWKRTVGVNIVINVDRAATDVGIPNPILVSEKFGGHTKAYANRRGIVLITKDDILKRLR